MQPQDYLKTQIRIMEIGQASSMLELDEFIACIESAEANAEKTNPEVFKRAGKNLECLKNLARVIQAVKLEFSNVLGAIKEGAEKHGHTLDAANAPVISDDRKLKCTQCQTTLIAKKMECPYCMGTGNVFAERARELGIPNGRCTRCNGTGVRNILECPNCVKGVKP